MSLTEARALLAEWVDNPHESLGEWWERVCEFLVRTDSTCDDEDMPNNDALLASAMRKIVTTEDVYFALYGGSACIDGWVRDLTTEEVAAIRALKPEVWDMPDA